MGIVVRYGANEMISVGIKITLGKEHNLSVVILWFDYLTPYRLF